MLWKVSSQFVIVHTLISIFSSDGDININLGTVDYQVHGNNIYYYTLHYMLNI